MLGGNREEGINDRVKQYACFALQCAVGGQYGSCVNMVWRQQYSVTVCVCKQGGMEQGGRQGGKGRNRIQRKLEWLMEPDPGRTRGIWTEVEDIYIF